MEVTLHDFSISPLLLSHREKSQELEKLGRTSFTLCSLSKTSIPLPLLAQTQHLDDLWWAYVCETGSVQYRGASHEQSYYNTPPTPPSIYGLRRGVTIMDGVSTRQEALVHFLWVLLSLEGGDTIAWLLRKAKWRPSAKGRYRWLFEDDTNWLETIKYVLGLDLVSKQLLPLRYMLIAKPPSKLTLVCDILATAVQPVCSCIYKTSSSHKPVTIKFCYVHYHPLCAVVSEVCLFNQETNAIYYYVQRPFQCLSIYLLICDLHSIHIYRMHRENSAIFGRRFLRLNYIYITNHPVHETKLGIWWEKFYGMRTVIHILIAKCRLQRGDIYKT